MVEVIVVGAGLAGLVCAQRLARAGVEVAVLEAGPRAGGVVGTREVEGFRFEQGPNTVPASSAEFRRLCGELGLAARLVASQESARERWLFHRGQLHAVPTSPGAWLRTELLSARAKLRLVSEPLRRWRPPAEGAPEPTLVEVLEERLGPEPTALFAGAFVRGIYAGDASRLGARSAFPRLWSLLEEHGGLVRGLLARARRAGRPGSEILPGPAVRGSQLLSFPGGFQELIDALVRELGARLRCQSPVARLAVDGELLAVESERGDSLRAPRLVLAVPAREAARLLAPLASAATTEFLARLPHAGVRLAHLGFAPGELTLPGGFGFLVPPGASGPGTPRALGCVFASNLFAARAPAGGAALTSFFALEGVQDLDAAAFGDLAAADLARALGLPRAPTPAAQWTTTWREAIPQYEPGHDLRMRAVGEDLAERVPGLVLAGGFTQGVSVEQVVARGRQVGEELLVERRR